MTDEPTPLFTKRDAQGGEAPRPYAHFNIQTNAPATAHGIAIDYETNDDNDTGVPSEVVTVTIEPNSLRTALHVTGYTRSGMLTDVEVRYNGECIHEERWNELIATAPDGPSGFGTGELCGEPYDNGLCRDVRGHEGAHSRRLD